MSATVQTQAEVSRFEPLRAALARNLLSPLQGVTFSGCCRLLREGRFAIDSPYWPRMGFMLATSLLNSGYALLDNAIFGRRIEETRVEPPLFILGHYRSGTTHLHNLLALDPGFSYPNVFQAFNPLTFLTAETMLTPTVKALLVRRRFQDNMAIAAELPTEDEVSLCLMTFLSPYMGWVFPRRGDDYDRYLTFRSASDDEIARWKAALVWFLKKLTLKHGGRPLILKSPPHTARVRLLLELFPDARFVHIRRDPFAVFRSTRPLYEAIAPIFRLQDRDEAEDVAGRDDRVFRTYTAMYDAYFEERALIPAGRLHEVGYEDLERDPIGQVEAIYRALDLPGFAPVRSRLESYLATISGYRKNAHPGLPESLRRRVAKEWHRSFEAWGYDPSGPGYEVSVRKGREALTTDEDRLS